MIRCKVINDRMVVFTKPGGVNYVDWVDKGAVVEVTEGWKYEERPWKNKLFVKVKLSNGKEGYAIASALSPINVITKR